ncbi:thiamine phosphate synthase [Legionella hackeliae]|uniref:Thiamine-phosphate synthase n=1 Tax=Legionella hackeliae TaxID=449 RepID=A0A0A8UKX5_LEGHA|nr:thiamine phosphate synthase [Legionella hackeliae]KTD14859.1 phosphomethylpyrimidine kinase/thiamin-phosphate pyrophosphorylase [Legionella hackeliae]CEK09515.1 Thiamine-phosphate pyrophosphorylase [Legionella hackeliae]STX49422.1 phosphomethylpyrimidine kinase/thiamin-phosphate pyrophosphorylase [Legionella hackeliae]
MRDPFYKFMLITHRQQISLPAYLRFIEQCVASGAGITSVQLREKKASFQELLPFASELHALLKSYQIPLIINDNIKLALEIDAEGVHLGQTDGSPVQARQVLGANKLLGLSIESEEELVRANNYELNYIAASAVFASKHKHNLRRLWGIDGVRELARCSLHPIVAIGGIHQLNVIEVLSAGAKGIAVIEALHDAEEPAVMARKLRYLIEGREYAGVNE